MQWTIGGSATEGRKHTDKLLSLMLRAFNGECDSAISRLRATNYQPIEDRISRAFAAINKLGAVQACELSAQYLELKIEELRLSHEHALKVQAEREQQRELKEQMRQEAIAARELEKAMQEAEAEEHRREVALEQARQELARAAQEQQSAERQAELEAKLKEMEQQLEEAHAAKERAISRAQQTKSGHVYVISNVGAFGENVFKIGMTRRPDPMDRIWELSDASVPFDFDVHALILTDDAPGLENELHKRFGDRRLNLVNERKEFFHATIDEIAEVVRERCGDIELTLMAEASEFFQSEAQRQARGLPLLANRHSSASFAGSQA
jgi:multidrug efflux pump subunit AcrA (membrane-fusion protein)